MWISISLFLENGFRAYSNIQNRFVEWGLYLCIDCNLVISIWGLESTKTIDVLYLGMEGYEVYIALNSYFLTIPSTVCLSCRIKTAIKFTNTHREPWLAFGSAFHENLHVLLRFIFDCWLP